MDYRKYIRSPNKLASPASLSARGASVDITLDLSDTRMKSLAIILH